MKKVTEMSATEKEEEELAIRKINTVDTLLNCLADDIFTIVTDSDKRIEINELINFYHKCMIDNFVDGDCAELAMNIITDPLSIKIEKQESKDLYGAEYYLNTKLNVETRKGKTQDEFRSMKSICEDIAKVFGADIDDKKEND